MTAPRKREKGNRRRVVESQKEGTDLFNRVGTPYSTLKPLLGWGMGGLRLRRLSEEKGKKRRRDPLLNFRGMVRRSSTGKRDERQKKKRAFQKKRKEWRPVRH